MFMEVRFGTIAVNIFGNRLVSSHTLAHTAAHTHSVVVLCDALLCRTVPPAPWRFPKMFLEV